MNTKNITQLFFFFWLTIASTPSYAVLKPLDHIVVIVNDDVITHTMLENRLNDFRKQLGLSKLSRIEPEALKKQVLEKMIRDTIQTQQAKQLGITIDDLMLNRMLEQMARSNNMSLEMFRDAIESEGINYTRFRKQTRDEVTIKQLQQRVIKSKVNVSDQEIQQHLEQNKSSDLENTIYHLRHILIATPESASSEDITKAEKKSASVYNSLSQGKNFEDLAIKESAGRHALKGGDLGKRKANELPQLFINEVIGLLPGQFTNPVKSASGFHILQLVSSSNDPLMIEQTHTRHILIRPSSEINDDQVRKKLIKLKNEIETGTSFTEVASEFSEDEISKIKGGDLGWTNPGDFTPAFENVINSLSAGQISEPFKTQFGWHIVEVLEHRDHDETQTNKTNQARNAIQKRKIDEELRLWLRRIRDEAYVEFVSDES